MAEQEDRRAVYKQILTTDLRRSMLPPPTVTSPAAPPPVVVAPEVPEAKPGTLQSAASWVADKTPQGLKDFVAPDMPVEEKPFVMPPLPSGPMTQQVGGLTAQPHLADVPMRKGYNAAEGYKKYEIGLAAKGLSAGALPEDDINELVDPQWYKTLPGWGELIQAPQRAAWAAAANIAPMLPEGGGLVESGFAKAFAAGMKTVGSPAGMSNVTEWGDELEEGGRNLYRALQSGALAQHAAAKRDNTFIDWAPGEGEWKMPKLDGVDLTYAAFPPDLAARMVAKAEADGDLLKAAALRKAFSPLGREGIGIGLEIMADPLWLMGPAKGAQVVIKGDKAFTLAARGAKAGVAIGDHLGESAVAGRMRVVDLVTGTALEQADAREVIEGVAKGLQEQAELLAGEAIKKSAMKDNPELAMRIAREQFTEANAALQDAIATKKGRLVIQELEKGVAKASKTLQVMSSDAGRAALVAREAATLTAQAKNTAIRASLVRSVLDEAPDVARKGVLSVSAPFGSKTRYLLPGEKLDLVRTEVGKLMPDVPDYKEVAKRRKLGEELTNSEKLGLLVFEHGGPKAADLTKGAAWLVNAAVGTTGVQPAYIVQRLRKFYEKTGVPIATILKKIPEEAWQRYHTVLQRHIARTAELSHDIRAKHYNFVDEGNKVLKDLKRRAPESLKAARAALGAAGTDAERRKAQALVDRWAAISAPKYTVSNVLTEAGVLVESGAGLLKGAYGESIRPLMAAIEEAKEAIRKQYDPADLLELDQAAQAVMRHASGNEDEFVELLGSLVRLAGEGPQAPTAGRRRAMELGLDAIAGSRGGLRKNTPMEDQVNWFQGKGLRQVNDPAGTIRALAWKWAPGGDEWFDDAANIEKLSTFLDGFKGGERALADVIGTMEPAVELGWLKDRLLEVQPRLRFHDIDRPLKEWETALWQGIIERTPDAPPEDLIIAAMAAISEVPGPNSEAFAKHMAAYGQVVGRRLQDLPAEMQGTVEALRSIVLSYEEMYGKVGMKFMKDPLARLRDWGIVDYVPHIAADEQKGAWGVVDDMLVSERIKAGGGVDSRLTTGMDATKRRAHAGTIEEINALSHMENGKVIGFHITPDGILGRYMQANRAISTVEFLAQLHDTGVMRMFSSATDAAAEGYVPLFSRGSTSLTQDFLNAPREALRAMGERNLLRQQLAEVHAPGSKGSAFASWAVTSPELQRQLMVDDALSMARLADPDFEPKAFLFREIGKRDGDYQAAYKALAAEVNRLNKEFPGVHIQGAWLSPSTFEQPISRMYLPASVVQGINDAFGSGERLGWPLELLRAADNFWKTRLTIALTRFTNRNFFSNLYVNMLDVGIWGAFNGRTNWTAAGLSTKAMVADKFGGGSWEKAVEEIAKKDSPAAWWAHTVWGEGDEGKRMLDSLSGKVDLGDGILRTTDEALELLRKEGVIGPNLGMGADISAAETSLMETLLDGKLDRAKQVASRMEDAAFVYMNFSLAGMPVALPKDIGSAYARVVESQARISNFVANMKRSGGDIPGSAAHVNKFLFNYDDLTAVQKQYMRLIFPFFTWSSKNFRLTFDIIRDNPAKFAALNRILLDDGPRAAMTYSTGKREEDVITPEEVAGRSEYAWNQVRFHFVDENGDRKIVQGAGFPLEGSAQVASILADSAVNLANPVDAYTTILTNPSEAMAMGSFMARWAVQMSTKISLQHAKKASELNDKYIDLAMRALFFETADVPIVGKAMYESMNRAFGDQDAIAVTDARTGEARVVYTMPRVKMALQGSPYSSMMANAGAAGDVSSAYVASNYGQYESQSAAEWDLGWRLLQVFTGIGVTNELAEVNIRRREKRKEEIMQESSDEKGATYTPPGRSVLR